MGRLQVEGLCKGWDFPVVDRVDLTVEEGEFFVIVGPSGIGKTTLLRLIAGLERPDAGVVRVGGVDITALPPYQRKVSMTFESYALYPHLTVFENIASPLRARKLDRATIKRKVTAVATLLRIESLLNRRPGGVSGGQKQRTALARTLVAEPEAFLLDEPISHLDAKIRHELRLQFHTLEALRSVATVYVTHDYSEALSLGDRIGIMGNGGLVQIGSAREVFQKPMSLFVAQHLGQPSINAIPMRLERRNGELRALASDDGPRALASDNEPRALASDGEFGFTITGQPAHALSERNAQAVTVGIRPQHLRVLGGRTDPGNGQVVDASVDIFEPLGSNGVLVADASGVKVTALTSPDRTYNHGQPIRLALETNAFFYFDPISGVNLLS